MMGLQGRERPGRQMAAILGLAVAAAVASNAVAGPTRRLSWRLPPVPAPVAARTAAPPPPAPAPGPAPVPQAPTGPGLAASGKAMAPAPALPSKPTLQSRFPAPADGAPQDIDGAAALALFRLGARFVDARRTSDFEAGHVPGARSLPVWEDGLSAKLQDLDAMTADPNDPLVIYCAGGGCRDSHELAQKLWLMGYRNLRIYTGGWPEWHEKGWPAAAGPEGAR